MRCQNFSIPLWMLHSKYLIKLCKFLKMVRANEILKPVQDNPHQDFTLSYRHYSFFMISACSWDFRLKSAYICLSLRFSSSSSFNRLTSEASMPPYLTLTTLALRLASLKQSPGLFLNVTHYRKSSSLCHADDIAL